MPHPTRQAFARWAATVLLTLAVVYPLSLGPVIYLAGETGMDNNSPSGRAMQAIYKPCEHLHQASELYAKYIDWWVLLTFKRMIIRDSPPPPEYHRSMEDQ